MELLLNSKSEYLLDGSLESLHAESLEWLKEIEFWQDGIAFFYKLLDKKKNIGAFPSEELAAIETVLVAINSDKLDKVRKELQNHEKALATIVRTTTKLEDDDYRHTHRKLLHEINDIGNSIMRLKKDVFLFVRKYEP